MKHKRREESTPVQVKAERVFTARSPQLFGGGGDCLCSERSAGADPSTEPKQSRVIVSFLLNRIRAQRCGGFRPPVNRTAGSCQKLPAGQLLTLAEVTELLQGLGVYTREEEREACGFLLHGYALIKSFRSFLTSDAGQQNDLSNYQSTGRGFHRQLRQSNGAPPGEGTRAGRA